MNKINYEKTINNYYYEQNKSLRFIHNYINELKTNRRINFNRWFQLYNFVLNLSDY